MVEGFRQSAAKPSLGHTRSRSARNSARSRPSVLSDSFVGLAARADLFANHLDRNSGQSRPSDGRQGASQIGADGRRQRILVPKKANEVFPEPVADQIQVHTTGRAP